MKRLQCKCGSEKFNVEKHGTALRCAVCFQRYWWKDNSGWTEIALYAEAKKKIVQTLISTANKPFEWAEYILHHPKRKKKQEEKPVIETEEFPIFRTKSADIEKRIKAGWKDEIAEFNRSHALYFRNHWHKGRLRGKQIAKVCHRDLARIGIKTRLRFDDGGGIVEAIS